MNTDENLNNIVNLYQPLTNFLNSVTMQLTIKAIIIYLMLIWIALIIWVTKDIVTRSNSIVMQVMMILLVVVLNVFGLVLYFILRPGKTLLQRYNEEVERKMLVETFSEFYNCVSCGAKVEKEFNYCPHCAAECKTICKSCDQVIMLGWQHCPYCQADVSSNLSSRREGTEMGGKINRNMQEKISFPEKKEGEV